MSQRCQVRKSPFSFDRGLRNQYAEPDRTESASSELQDLQN
jgi:hypothetical protein